MANTLSPTFLFALSLFCITDAQAKSVHPDYQLLCGEVQQYGDWLVGCDNNAECTMIGFPETTAPHGPDVAAHAMAIQISLKRTANLIPAIELVPFALNDGRKASDDKAEPFVLNIKYDGVAISPDHGFSRQELPPVEAAAVIRHLGLDKPLEGTALSNGKVIVRFPKAEFKRAFTAMQKRHVRLQKELAKKAIDEQPGGLPEGNSMPMQAKHRRIPAMPLILPGLAPIYVAKNCGDSPIAATRRYGFPDGTELWSYSCDDGSYPSRTYWETAPKASMLTTPLSLPEPRDVTIHAGLDGLDNAVFDFDFGILRAYKYQKNREDCGTFRAWGFTENGWQLLERREMPLCMGLNPNDWIRTHYTPTDGAGSDE